MYRQDWRIVVGRPSPAVQAYLDHFDRMCDGLQPRGAALLAHAYTQQTAMLFGGQRVSGMVRKYIGIQDDEPGTSAFEFKVCMQGALYMMAAIPVGMSWC